MSNISQTNVLSKLPSLEEMRKYTKDNYTKYYKNMLYDYSPEKVEFPGCKSRQCFIDLPEFKSQQSGVLTKDDYNNSPFKFIKVPITLKFSANDYKEEDVPWVIAVEYQISTNPLNFDEYGRAKFMHIYLITNVTIRNDLTEKKLILYNLINQNYYPYEAHKTMYTLSHSGRRGLEHYSQRYRKRHPDRLIDFVINTYKKKYHSVQINTNEDEILARRLQEEEDNAVRTAVRINTHVTPKMTSNGINHLFKRIRELEKENQTFKSINDEYYKKIQSRNDMLVNANKIIEEMRERLVRLEQTILLMKCNTKQQNNQETDIINDENIGNDIIDFDI